jgi:hypothetical protein
MKALRRRPQGTPPHHCNNSTSGSLRRGHRDVFDRRAGILRLIIGRAALRITRPAHDHGGTARRNVFTIEPTAAAVTAAVALSRQWLREDGRPSHCPSRHHSNRCCAVNVHIVHAC